jgi:hypothetical protein
MRMGNRRKWLEGRLENISLLLSGQMIRTPKSIFF